MDVRANLTMGGEPIDSIQPAIPIGEQGDMSRIGSALDKYRSSVDEAARLANSWRQPGHEVQEMVRALTGSMYEATQIARSIRGPLFELSQYATQQQRLMASATRDALLASTHASLEIGRAVRESQAMMGEAMRASRQLTDYFAGIRPEVERIGAAIRTATQSPGFHEALKAVESLSRNCPELFDTPGYSAVRDAWQLAAEQAAAEHVEEGALSSGGIRSLSLPQISPENFASLVSLLLAILAILYSHQQAAESETRLNARLDQEAKERAAFEVEVTAVLEELLLQVAPTQRFVSRAREVVVRQSPHSGSQVMAHIPPRQLVVSRAQRGKWIRVEYLDSESRVSSGWALKKYFDRVERAR